MNFGFPNWLRVVWWLALLGGLGSLLWMRLDAFAAGISTPVDAVVFLVFMALLVAPLVGEVNILGVSLKAEVEQLKTELRTDMASLKAVLTSAVDVRNTISPVFQLSVAPDPALKALEARLEKALKDLVASSPHPVPPDAQNLFAVRFNLERELKRIAKTLDLGVSNDRVVSIPRLLGIFAEHGVLSSDLATAARELYAISSRAIHGDEVTDAQRSFVNDVTPKVLGALKQSPLGPQD